VKFKEIEFKYDARDISMEKFVEMVEGMHPNKRMLVSSYDDYFTDEPVTLLDTGITTPVVSSLSSARPPIKTTMSELKSMFLPGATT
jgi:methionine synthase II (cobalamin-independent)